MNTKERKAKQAKDLADYKSTIKRPVVLFKQFCTVLKQAALERKEQARIRKKR